MEVIIAGLIFALGFGASHFYHWRKKQIELATPLVPLQWRAPKAGKFKPRVNNDAAAYQREIDS